MAAMVTTVPEAHNAYAGQGAVLLDIGGDIGALVVEMPADTVGLEVEIRPLGPGHATSGAGDEEKVRAHAHEHTDHVHAHAHTHQHGHGDGHEHLAHVAVVPRPIGDRHVPSLVFADLQAGGYELFEKGHSDRVALRVDVAGGEVTSATWPGAA